MRRERTDPEQSAGDPARAIACPGRSVRRLAGGPAASDRAATEGFPLADVAWRLSRGKGAVSVLLFRGLK